MTIRPSVNVRELNQQLSELQDCARNAPEGCYDQAKEFADNLEEIFSGLSQSIKDTGLKAVGDDGFREIEALIYGHIKESNPDLFSMFAVSEGFGRYSVDHTTRDRVMKNAIRDRDFIRSRVTA